VPKKPGKPGVAIVGAGNLASALAVALRDAGYTIEQIIIDQIIARGPGPSLQRARRLAREVGASAAVAKRARIHAELVWFCVPDSAIAGAAESLVAAADWKGRVALHSSGALAADALDPLRLAGAAVASVHPMMTFVRGARSSLKDVPFAVEGDARALRMARVMVRDLRGQTFPIRKEQKEAYHAWGMFASPLFDALLAAAERVAEAAGVPRKVARERMLPILRQTLNNYGHMGAAESFSGPIARGDVATVEKHLRVLRNVPGGREVYVALAWAAMRDLPVKNREGLEGALTGKSKKK
jgi:predicted short-subunit dehydrogenase-like oxidoreductase (DUF2520 family)